MQRGGADQEKAPPFARRGWTVALRKCAVLNFEVRNDLLFAAHDAGQNNSVAGDCRTK